MTTSLDAEVLGRTLIDFSYYGRFPEESVSASVVDVATLPAALQALNHTKASLETEVRQISQENHSTVDAWIEHAQNLQKDINKSRKLASEIVQQAEAEEAREKELQDKEIHVALLEKEIYFNAQLVAALQTIKRTNDALLQAEKHAAENRLREALESLEVAGREIRSIPTDRNVRAVRLLDHRYTEIRKDILEKLRFFRRSLISINPKSSSIEIRQQHHDIPTDLDDITDCLMAYNELEDTGKELWKEINQTVLRHRIGLGAMPDIFALSIRERSIHVNYDQHADHTIKSLCHDLEDVINCLANNLPAHMVKSLSNAMMADLYPTIIDVWLDMAIPSTLECMEDYQKVLAVVQDFAAILDSMNWPGSNILLDWVSSAPKNWLKKRRDGTLDWIRNELSLGLGDLHAAEHIEKREVTRDDGIAVTSNGEAITDEWGWGDDEDKHSDLSENNLGGPVKSRASLDEERTASTVNPVPEYVETVQDIQADEEEDAWGWGDDENTDAPPVSASPMMSPTAESPMAVPPMAKNDSQRSNNPEKRTVAVSETYWISSMPVTVLRSITTIYEDGAKLMQEVNAPLPVAPAAGGLFSIPRLVLAMYRSLSPFYYANDQKGNMYSYNDSMWLSDKLKDFSDDWHSRKDLPARAYKMVDLDPEVKALQSFGRRAYKNEMDTQRTILQDLLGGSQNLYQQEDAEAAVPGVIDHIKRQSESWSEILPNSTWCSAVGTLVNTVATKIIHDVFDLPDLGIDEAERIASLIVQTNELDSLFKPKANGNEDEDAMPKTGQYASNWIRMQFLGEVLQSNLNDIRYLWFKSHLSLYFTKDEVVDLIELSFEKNTKSKELIRDIREKPVDAKF